MSQPACPDQVAMNQPVHVPSIVKEVCSWTRNVSLTNIVTIKITLSFNHMHWFAFYTCTRRKWKSIILCSLVLVHVFKKSERHKEIPYLKFSWTDMFKLSQVLLEGTVWSLHLQQPISTATPCHRTSIVHWDMIHSQSKGWHLTAATQSWLSQPTSLVTIAIKEVCSWKFAGMPYTSKCLWVFKFHALNFAQNITFSFSEFVKNQSVNNWRREPILVVTTFVRTHPMSRPLWLLLWHNLSLWTPSQPNYSETVRAPISQKFESSQLWRVSLSEVPGMNVSSGISGTVLSKVMTLSPGTSRFVFTPRAI